MEVKVQLCPGLGEQLLSQAVDTRKQFHCHISITRGNYMLWFRDETPTPRTSSIRSFYWILIIRGSFFFIIFIIPRCSHLLNV